MVYKDRTEGGAVTDMVAFLSDMELERFKVEDLMKKEHNCHIICSCLSLHCSYRSEIHALACLLVANLGK